MKKFIILSLILVAVASTFVFAASLPVLAAAETAPAVPTNLDVWGAGTEGVVTEEGLRGDTGLGSTDPRAVVAQVINIILGFLGIIAVIIILLGGFKWMTAGGSEDKVGEARKLIVAGIIGLVIILGSFAIASFVINQLVSATGGA